MRESKRLAEKLYQATIAVAATSASTASPSARKPSDVAESVDPVDLPVLAVDSQPAGSIVTPVSSICVNVMVARGSECRMMPGGRRPGPPKRRPRDDRLSPLRTACTLNRRIELTPQRSFLAVNAGMSFQPPILSGTKDVDVFGIRMR